jgi:glycyl-tRNA synthetase beta chain
MLADLGEAAKRVGNILKKSDFQPTQVNENLFDSDAEKELLKTLCAVKSALSACNLEITEECCRAFEELLKFKNPLEDFFAKVMVNDTDSALKNNRLALLKEIDFMLAKSVADLSKLQNKREVK